MVRDIFQSKSDRMLNTSLIFGQEPDNFRGGFDKAQSYIGELAEFNIWNYGLNGQDISNMASCRSVPKGNIVSWDESNWVYHNVPINSEVETADFCSQNIKYIIFPEKVRYPEARKICEIHGGSLALPRSENETRAILDIVFEHQETCIGKEIVGHDSSIWIAAKKSNFEWYEIGEEMSESSIGSRLSYTKVIQSTTSSTTKCTYIRNDGAWLDGIRECNRISLCIVCQFKTQPVVTVKGVCYDGEIDWNFYPIIGARNELEKYEGYKKVDITYDNKTEKWNIVAKPGYPQNFIAYFSKNEFTTITHPIGRKKWFYQDKLCQVKDSRYSFSISICDYPTQFTCNSGHCIDISKRCDEKADCLDKSDEDLCHLINVPLSYNRANAPESSIDGSPLEIKIQSRIIAIDSIDTVNMIVTVTLELDLEWFDKRLTFSNPDTNQGNLISNQKSKTLWNPLRDVIHENAIIGEIKYGNDFTVKIHAKYPEDLDASKAIENRMFNGSSNYLAGTRRMKAKYNCEFEAKKFPFDETNCHFIMKINQRRDTHITFVNDGKVLYDGKNEVGQFLIGDMTNSVRNTNDSTRNIVSIRLTRLYANQIITTFIPTLILWFFGYITLFIEPDEDGFSDRFMGAGTALLVTVTLLNAVNNDLPKTSYMKYIDLWFMWHVISVFLMIAYHIVLDRLRSYFNKHSIDDDQVIPFKELEDDVISLKKDGWKIIHQINDSLIIIFPGVNGIFYGIYFYLTLA